MRPRWPLAFAAVIGTALPLGSACSRQEPRPPALKASIAQLVPALQRAVAVEPEREPRAHTPTLYIDGAPVLALTYLELPPSLPTRWKALTSGQQVRRFRVAELLQAVGLKLEGIQQVHIYGGRDRISIVKGSELRRMKEKLLFSFTQSDRGRPRIHYPDEDMDVSSRVDLVDDITVYARKEPPRSEGKYQTLTFADGRPIEGIPYATTERPGGTRVYVDGALKTFIKRRTLPSSLAEAGTARDAAPRFSLRAYLDTLGIGWGSLKGMELLGASAVVARLDLGELTASPPITFTLARRSRGLISVDLAGSVEPIEAISLYIHTLPPDRSAQSGAPEKKE